VTNNFDAEQGLAGGAAINVQIKSGTNRIRGSAFEYHFNEKMRAKNYFTPAGTDEGKWRDDQFGGTLGGPVKQNKLFYFVSYEGTRQNRQVPRTVSVPTLAVRNGDFTATGTTVYDPATGNRDGTGRTPFPGNVIPQGRVSEVAKKLMAQMPLPNLPGEMNNYFVQPGFVFNRWTVDSKVNWNATDRLQIFGRYSQLDFYQNSETLFGDQLQGDDATGGGNPGIGWGDTYNFSSGITYTLGNNIVMDGHFGWVRMGSNVEMTDVRENKGLDWLGIPGTNGPELWDGGTPFFDLDGYADIGTVENFMPYYRNDDQYQTVANLTWLKGRHNIRFGGDLYFTTLNHIQPEIADTNFGARGGWNFNSGPTQLRGGPGGTNFNSFASFLLGLPSQVGRLKLNVAPYTTRSWQYSFYVRDQWQVGPKMTLSFGTRYEYFPIPTRADRGLERYNLATNLVEIGGLGGVPKDLGIPMQKNLFSPRLGVTYRLTDKAVLRGGFGITNDPYSLARPMRTNHPVLTNLVDSSPDSFTWVRRVEEGIPIIDDPDLGTGIVPVPGNVTVVTLPDDFRRGRVESWNVAFEKELMWGLTGEATYVGTRQVDQLGVREQNWSPIDGGNNGRQLVQRFGRTASTLLIAPVGNSHYNALQTRLSKRFRDGFSFNVNYTLSKAIGLRGAPNSDNQPVIRIPDMFHLNRGLADFDRTHVVNVRSIAELPFGTGRRWLNQPGLVSAILGGWQLNNILSLRSGTPFTVTTPTTPLNTPSITQNPADQIKDDVEILGGVGRGNSYFDPFAFAVVSEARLGTAGFNSLRGPGRKQWDVGLFRQINVGGQRTLQVRVEAFNVTNTPHFGNPGASRSSLQLNPDGTIRNLNGYTEITGTSGSKSERQVRVGLRLGF
jgi:hypothetical protein